jgi:L-galactose dehydrogenase
MIDLAIKPTYKPNKDKQKEIFSHGTRIVLGCSGLGGVWGNQDFSESVDVILMALEAGIGSFDAAPSYNKAEHFLGQALKQWKGQKPYISTKVGRLFSERADEYDLDYTKDGMRKSLETSLERLGLESIDLLFLHEPQLVTAQQKDEIVDTLASFKRERDRNFL